MSCQVWHELSLSFFILELCLVFSVSVEDCKFMNSKMRPLFLVFKNWDDLGDLVRVIFKNGDGECGISFDRLIVTLLKRCTCSLAILVTQHSVFVTTSGKETSVSLEWLAHFTLGLKSCSYVCPSLLGPPSCRVPTHNIEWNIFPLSLQQRMEEEPNWFRIINSLGDLK